MASGKDWVVLQHVAHEEPGAIGEAVISAGHVVSVVRIDRGPHQAFRYGERAYGLQFHVEFTPRLAGQWRPYLPPGVSMPAIDVVHINKAGRGLVQRFVALAQPEGIREDP